MGTFNRHYHRGKYGPRYGAGARYLISERVTVRIKGLSLGRHKRTYSAVERHWAMGRTLRLGVSRASRELDIPAMTLSGWTQTVEYTELAARFAARDSLLSRREREIMDALAVGKSYADIAAETGTSVRTVESQALTVRRKLGVPGGKPLAEFAEPLEFPPKLSLRERQVLDLLFDGLTYPDIARRNGVSTRTIETQVRSVFRKAGVADRRELAFRLALVEVDRATAADCGKPPVRDPM